MPFALGLLVFTFLFIIPELMRYAESYISKGAPTLVIIRLVIALIPMALGLTIPMSLLLGLLVTFGRLSADREFVALQACGVSPLRLMRPVGVLAVAGCLATGYVMLVAVPDANQSFREITFNVIATQAEGEVKPRVFYDEFPNIVLYVREIPQAGGWNGVFMGAEGSAQPGLTRVHFQNLPESDTREPRSAATCVDEESRTAPFTKKHRPRRAQILPHPLSRFIADRHDPLLVALPRARQVGRLQIDVGRTKRDELRHPHAGRIQQLDERPIAEPARCADVWLLDQPIDVVNREISRQHFPRARRSQVVGRTRLDPSVDDQKAIEPAIARDGSRHRTRRTTRGHHVADEVFEVGERQGIDRRRPPGGVLGERLEIARVALNGIRRKSALDSEMRQIRVKRGHAAQKDRDRIVAVWRSVPSGSPSQLKPSIP